MSTLQGKTILITGANRGIGKALMNEVLKHDPKKVIATSRNVDQISDSRVEVIQLDLLNKDTFNNFDENVDVLINNAGVFSSMEDQNEDKNMSVNYFATKSFFNHMESKINSGGVIANILSIVSLIPMPGGYLYSASKAALHSFTISKRLLNKNINVLGVYPGPIDTDMTKGMGVSKASPEETAKNIIEGIINKEEYIFPDPFSKTMGDKYLESPRMSEGLLAG